MTLNAELETNKGFEFQTKDMTPNVKLNNGPECWTEDMALNAKLKVWIWTPNCRYGSEHQTEEIHDDFECRTKNKYWKMDMMALNAKLK